MGCVNLIFFFFFSFRKKTFCSKLIHSEDWKKLSDDFKIQELCMQKVKNLKRQSTQLKHFSNDLCENIFKVFLCEACKRFFSTINRREKLFFFHFLPRAVSVVVMCMFWINLTNFSMKKSLRRSQLLSSMQRSRNSRRKKFLMRFLDTDYKMVHYC